MGNQGPGKGLPGSMVEQRLWQVPGEVVGSKLREGRYTRPCLFCRSPWRIGPVRSLYCKGSTENQQRMVPTQPRPTCSWVDRVLVTPGGDTEGTEGN